MHNVAFSTSICGLGNTRVSCKSGTRRTSGKSGICGKKERCVENMLWNATKEMQVAKKVWIERRK